jgi:CheY-like chemotaxis protein
VAKPRVLVVDDERLVGEAVRRVLGKAYEVELVCSGHLALERLGSSEYDAILCDLMMPGLTGMDLFFRIAETHPFVAARFLFITGGACSDDAHRFLESVPHVDKPFSPAELRAAVAQVVRG